MYIILSQKIDVESSYEDKIYSVYNFPKRYKNSINEGDTFIYYQGDRKVRDNRYYFGTGKIGKVTTTNEENYFAELHDCKRFEHKVPIYKGEKNYIEQIGYSQVRKAPPWQTSIRPISKEAYDYIIRSAGELLNVNNVVGNVSNKDTMDDFIRLKNELLKSFNDFYVNNDYEAIESIARISKKISKMISE